MSEEHDESKAPSSNISPMSGIAGLELTKAAEHVPKNDITVWIDPLDATQEYTGTSIQQIETHLWKSAETVLKVVLNRYNGEMC